jgi:pyruvate/2-oxoglutarate/acetoin dehydrogenase E1 component
LTAIRAREELQGSVTAEIPAVIAGEALHHFDVPVPFSPVLEDLTVPSEQTVFEAARARCRKS